MIDDVRFSTLASLIDAGTDSRSLNGVQRVDAIIPVGRYWRRPPVSADTAALLPREQIFHQYVSSLVQDFGPIERFVLRDALVTDQGAVVTCHGALIEESCWEFLKGGGVPHGLVRDSEKTFRITGQPAREIRVPTLLLKRPWWRNYGHWLVDAAALIALLAERGAEGIRQLAIGAAEDTKLREIMRQTLSLIAPDIPVIEHPDAAMWLFAELHYVTPVRRSPLCAVPEAIEALHVAVLGHHAAKPGDRRLFISRRNYGGRRLANEAEIVEVCDRHGFEVVYPELGTLSEQAALFRSASAIVGVKGAALANLVFSGPGTVVVVLSPGDFADPFFWDIAGARNFSYSEIFGPLTTAEYRQGQNPFTIDPKRLDRMLSNVLPPPRYPWSFVPLVGVPSAPADNISGGMAMTPGEAGERRESCLARTKPTRS